MWPAPVTPAALSPTPLSAAGAELPPGPHSTVLPQLAQVFDPGSMYQLSQTAPALPPAAHHCNNFGPRCSLSLGWLEFVKLR